MAPWCATVAVRQLNVGTGGDDDTYLEFPPAVKEGALGLGSVDPHLAAAVAGLI